MVGHRIRVYGVVQGIGFRPFVKRLADEHSISGSVCNRGSYVEIEAFGRTEDLAVFEEGIVKQHPSSAFLVKVDVEDLMPGSVSQANSGFDSSGKEDVPLGFTILHSVSENGRRFVSPDLALCSDCRRELLDPGNRRYLHPFINCTNCGPRLTILDSLPYDRERTSMQAFSMCPECRREYTNSSDRRYHAQPICCPDDGPRLRLLSSEGIQEDHEAVSLTREVIRRGGIAAVKGIGGFHLVCDGENETAIATLRKRKHRPKQPFALMMRDLKMVRSYCHVSDREASILSSSAAPILLLRQREDSGRHLPHSLAPDRNELGVMLPYTPVHTLLFSYPDGKDFPDSLVMTSGNISGAPIASTTEEAVRDLSDLADVILTNDREIRIRADDSVLRVHGEENLMIRRSRGYAPLPIVSDLSAGEAPWSKRGSEKGYRGNLIRNHMSTEHRGRVDAEERVGDILAMGGELKNCFVLQRDTFFYPSPYVGDLSDDRAGGVLLDGIGKMTHLLEIHPDHVAVDLHPGYVSSALGRRYAEKHNGSCFAVQHHFAHARSCAGENNHWDEPVIGVVYDGTGYGTDGTIWGGEFLLAYPDHFIRRGSLSPFTLPGGDAAAKEGWRAALGLLHQLWSTPPSDQKEEEKVRGGCHTIEEGDHYIIEETERSLADPFRRQMIKSMLQQEINTGETTSVGRLFDGIAAILGICRASTYEGEAAQALERAASSYLASGAWRKDRDVLQEQKTEGEERWLVNYTEEESRRTKRGMGYSDRTFLLSGEKILLSVLRKANATQETSGIPAALHFHRILAEATLEGCRRCRVESGIRTVALSGGVFQNMLLLDLVTELLSKDGFRVLIHHELPSNDGGIALGQAAALRSYLLKKRKPSDSF